MKITKKFRFEGSHVVRNCTSQRCSNSTHGHSYEVEIEFEGRRLDNAQMLYDFGLMKGSIKEFIDSMDHCHIISAWDSEEYKEFFKTHNERWIEVPFNPSAEMLSVFIMRYVQYILQRTQTNNGEGSDLHISGVTVHETVTGRAKCDEEDVNNLWADSWIPAVVFSKGVIADWSDDLRNIFFKDVTYMISNPTPKQQITLIHAHELK